jgi:hypothetical protein
MTAAKPPTVVLSFLVTMNKLAFTCLPICSLTSKLKNQKRLTRHRTGLDLSYVAMPPHRLIPNLRHRGNSKIRWKNLFRAKRGLATSSAGNQLLR